MQTMIQQAGRNSFQLFVGSQEVFVHIAESYITACVNNGPAHLHKYKVGRTLPVDRTPMEALFKLEQSYKSVAVRSALAALRHYLEDTDIAA